MATFNKIEKFLEDLFKKVHDLHNDVLKVYASNTAPNAATHTVKADVAEITAANGYPSGGTDVQNVVSRSGGTTSVTATDVVWTASGGSFGPLRYIPLYNDTPAATPTDPLIGWWDYGSSITILDGESFTVDFGASLFSAT